MDSKRGLLAFALLFCLLETALSIKCYQCTPLVEGDCLKSLKELPIVDCGQINESNFSDKNLSTFFGSVIQRIKALAVEVDGDYYCGSYEGLHVPSNSTATIRTCINGRVSCEIMKATLGFVTNNNFKVDTCNNCTTDYCNSSNSVQAGAFVLGFSLLLTLLFSDKL